MYRLIEYIAYPFNYLSNRFYPLIATRSSFIRRVCPFLILTLLPE